MSKHLIKYSINTCVDFEDIVASTLFDCGIIGVEIEDKVGLTDEELKAQYVDIPIELKNDGKAKVIFYVEEVDSENEKNIKKDVDTKIVDISYDTKSYNQFTHKEIEEILDNFKYCIIEKEDITNFDYMNNWKNYFKKIYIDNICIKPSYDKDEEKDKIVIKMDPKGAFGTGSHETTRLCIEELNRQVKNGNAENMLDIGCGSGILGIIAMKLGVKNVLSIDVDDTIKDTIYENVEMNDIKKSDFRYIVGNIIDDKKLKDEVGYNNYDIICANILTPVIISLITVGEIDKHIKKGGILITSGILDKYEKDVIDAINKNSNLELIDVKKKGEWVNINIRCR